jgi:hypothetical protein
VFAPLTSLPQLHNSNSNAYGIFIVITDEEKICRRHQKQEEKWKAGKGEEKMTINGRRGGRRHCLKEKGMPMEILKISILGILEWNGTARYARGIKGFNMFLLLLWWTVKNGRRHDE